jgi:hypothetical protein
MAVFPGKGKPFRITIYGERRGRDRRGEWD